MTFNRGPLSSDAADRRSAIVWQRMLLGLSLALAGWDVASGEEQAPPAGASESDATNVESERTPAIAPAVPVKTADDEQARRRAFSTGVVMLGGILICGVGLIAVVLLWGNRARRMARQSLPRVAPRDELWYLKRAAEANRLRSDEQNDDDASSPEAKA